MQEESKERHERLKVHGVHHLFQGFVTKFNASTEG